MRLCRVCGFGLEDWGHVLERCAKGSSSVDEGQRVNARVRWILYENGQGEKWISELERMKGEEKREISKLKRVDE